MKYITIKTIFKYATIIFLLLIAPINSVFASMIGDTLTFRRAYPDITTDFAPSVSTIVESGNADIVSNQPGFLTINPESNNIIFDFPVSSAFGGTASVFDGFEITGFSNAITNAFIFDVTGVTIVGLSFSDKLINLNLAGRYEANSFINMGIEFAPNPVPIPGSVFLFFVGLILLFGYSYKNNRFNILNQLRF